MESIKKVWAKMKEHKKASIIGAAVIVVLLIVIAVNNSSSNGFYTIDVAQNYKLECSGDNGYANPNASIDSTAKDNLIESILFKLYPNSSDDYVKWDKYQKFIDNIKFTYNKEDHISNGDEITATANYDKNQAKELKLKLKDTTLKTTASDLYEYITANTNVTDQLKESLDKIFNDAISSDSISSSSPSYLGETNKAKDMWKALTNEEALWVTASTSEPINATEKYQLNPKNTSDPSQFIYFYTITLTHKYVIPSWDNDTATEEKTCVIAVSGKDLKYFYGSDGAYVKGSVAVVDKDTPCYKNIEEAKEKLLDKNSYDIKEI